MTPDIFQNQASQWIAVMVVIAGLAINAYFNIKAQIQQALTAQKTDAAQAQLDKHSEDIKSLIGGAGEPITAAAKADVTAHAEALKSDLSSQANALASSLAKRAAIKTVDFDRAKMKAAHDALEAALASDATVSEASPAEAAPTAPEG